MTNTVNVRLTTGDMFDIASRVEEVQTIQQWIKELVEHDETKFEISYMASGDCLKITFEENRHAMLCALRWL